MRFTGISLPIICTVLSFTTFLSGQRHTEIGGPEIQAFLDSADKYQLTDPSRALEFAMALMHEVPSKGSETVHIRALLIAANSQKMRSQTESALSFASEAVELSRILDEEYLLRSTFMKATIFDQVDNRDSSVVYYQRVIDLHKPGIDPYFVTTAYSAVGQIMSTIGNDEKAEEYILRAYRMSAGDDYARTFALARVISFYARRGDSRYLPYLDSLAMTDFYKKSTPASFMAHFDSFLLLTDASAAEKEKKLREVYAYSEKHSSLVNQVGFGMKLCEFLREQGRFAEGYLLLLELADKSKASGNAIHQAGITRALYENSKARGDLTAALAFLERHSRLRDSLLSEENRETISELNIRFETSQKDHEIAQQQVRLQQGRRNRSYLIALSGLMAVLAAVIFLFLRNRVWHARRIAEQEKIIYAREKENLVREREVAELTASLEAQERERNRLARDLHDGLGSLMSGISSQIEFLRVQPAKGVSEHPQLLHLREMVNEASSELRRTSYELMPAKLLRNGLEPAVRDLCMNLVMKNGIETQLEIPEDPGLLPPDQQLILYRIVQELLNNIVRHAEASHVMVQLTSFGDEFSLVVEDNGRGFDVQDKFLTGGLGLGSLRSRVDLLRGFLDIASSPGEGTTVTVNFIRASASPSEA